ncbi:MAG TPA: hypothetical protein ENF73_04935, partial [Proteobacteria bacterium]|nr:hypothetical protein [Pseudomonadota bacterium]
MKGRGCLIVAVVLLAANLFTVVWDHFAFDREGRRYSVVYRELTRAEKEAVARAALDLLASGEVDDPPSFMVEEADGDYMLFVSFALHGGRTKVSFGRGSSILAALRMACKEQARLWISGVQW